MPHSIAFCAIEWGDDAADDFSGILGLPLQESMTLATSYGTQDEGIALTVLIHLTEAQRFGQPLSVSSVAIQP